MCRRAELDSYLPWFTDQGNRLEGPMSSREMCVIIGGESGRVERRRRVVALSAHTGVDLPGAYLRGGERDECRRVSLHEMPEQFPFVPIARTHLGVGRKGAHA